MWSKSQRSEAMKMAVCFRANAGCVSPTECPCHLENAWDGQRGCMHGIQPTWDRKLLGYFVPIDKCPLLNGTFKQPKVIEVDDE